MTSTSQPLPLYWAPICGALTGAFFVLCIHLIEEWGLDTELGRYKIYGPPAFVLGIVAYGCLYLLAAIFTLKVLLHKRLNRTTYWRSFFFIALGGTAHYFSFIVFMSFLFGEWPPLEGFLASLPVVLGPTALLSMLVALFFRPNQPAEMDVMDHLIDS